MTLLAQVAQLPDVWKISSVRQCTVEFMKWPRPGYLPGFKLPLFEQKAKMQII